MAARGPKMKKTSSSLNFHPILMIFEHIKDLFIPQLSYFIKKFKTTTARCPKYRKTKSNSQNSMKRPIKGEIDKNGVCNPFSP